jgi:hypothetical protein
MLTDLKAYYAFDEASGNAIDAHGPHDLVETSGTIAATTGKVSGARDLERGDTEVFTVADHADLRVGDIDFSYAIWVNFESLVSTENMGAKWLTTGDQREWRVRATSTGDLIFDVSRLGTLATVVSVTWSATLSTGTWYLVIVEHDSVNNHIGISVNNGTMVTTSHSTGVFGGTAPFEIGDISPNNQQFDGLVDEAAFAKRIWTADEKTWIYNGGNGRSYADWAATESVGTINLFVANKHANRMALIGGRAL